MGVFDNAKKVPTGVCGLDSLFYDGLQLQNFNEKDSSSENKSRNKEKGLIIMLKGVRGINKMHLAMQMLHGISRSIYSIPGLSKYASVPYFFSLNKTKEDLSDFFLDYLITRQIDIIIRKSASGEDASWKQDILAKSLFTVDRCSEQCVQNANHSVYLPKDYRNCLDKYLCDRIIYYNNRTNALHFLRDYEGDDDDNLLFHRRSDDLTYYWGKGKDNLRFLPQYMRDDFFDVRFNERLSGEDFFDCDNTMYSYSAGQKFQKVLDCLENIEMENAEKQEVAEDNDRDKQNGCSRSWARQYSPCIVIDGFAQLHTDELERLSFPHIEKVLRRLSMVSILVFDERANNITCNADIVIDMRKKEYADEDYAFHELQISKSVFQPAAFGWHKYKIRNCGIEVYPSIHRLLQRRNYMSKILTHTHANILDESYERFMRTERLQYHNIADPNISYDNYQAEKSDREMDLLKEMYRKGKEARLRLTKKIIPKHYATDILEAVLLGGPMKSPLDENCYHTDDRKMHALGSSSRWREYKSVTALIGNPNSFKRFLAIARTFRASKHKEHTLVILFDKEEDEMRRQFICPGFNTYEADFLPCLELMDLSEQDKLDELNSNNKYKRENVYPKYPINNRRCSTCSYKCKLKECCLRCYKYIHFLNVRMGCISADELYSVLKQQINVPYFDGINQKKVSRIVIDDLQKIDYSFPLLKDEHLFLTALVTLCRENDVELQILCDKKAGLTKELCSLADNVVCINRDKADTNSIVLYLERFAEHISPSEIIQYNIDNISELFKCDGADIRLDAIVREEKDEIKELETNISNTPGQGDTKADSMSNETECFKACIKFKCIGSMKDYWRMKIDIGNTRQV